MNQKCNNFNIWRSALDILNNLKKFTDEKNILINEPMKKHTSFKIGGNADFIVVPKSKDEIISLIDFL